MPRSWIYFAFVGPTRVPEALYTLHLFSNPLQFGAIAIVLDMWYVAIWLQIAPFEGKGFTPLTSGSMPPPPLSRQDDGHRSPP
jgi:hypothetical protein